MTGDVERELLACYRADSYQEGDPVTVDFDCAEGCGAWRSTGFVVNRGTYERDGVEYPMIAVDFPSGTYRTLHCARCGAMEWGSVA